jgi:hypothetical protein
MTEKKSREHHEGYIMDKTFFTQHVFFKMYEKSGDKKYGETVLHFSAYYDAIHLMRKGIFTKFG